LQALVVARDEEELRWLLNEVKLKLGPVADVEYRTRIESALASLRSGSQPPRPPSAQ
jgi:hypothetical protein